jgi:hypothetical protein
MSETKIPNDFFINEGKIIEEIFRKAVRDALLVHIRANNSVAVWQDDKVVILPPEDITLLSQ